MTFLCPIDNINDDSPIIISVFASNYTEAEDKIEEEIRQTKEIKRTGTWNDFIKAAAEVDIYIGNIYDKDEF